MNEKDKQPNADKFYPTFFLGLLFGVFGVHSFYNGKIRNGILQLITFGGLGIWWLIDMILILTGNFQDNEKERVPNINPKISWTVFVIVILIAIASGGGDTDDFGKDNQTANSESTIVNELTEDARKLVGTYQGQSSLGEIGLILGKDSGYVMTFIDRESRHAGSWEMNGSKITLYSDSAAPMELFVTGQSLNYDDGTARFTLVKTASF